MTADNGSITFWDYKTGLPFQTMVDMPQPGSLDAEAGIFCSTFDQTGSRLITGGADKTIKVRHSWYLHRAGFETDFDFVPRDRCMVKLLELSCGIVTL